MPKLKAQARWKFVEPERRPEQRVAVRRVGDRAVDHARHAGLGEDRHARHRVLDVALEALEVVLEQLHAEAGRRLAAVPGEPAVPLVGPEQQPGALLAQVPGDVGIAHQRQRPPVRRDRRDRLGHQILVLHADHRQVEPDHAADLARPVARGIDHGLAGDRAILGHDPPFAAGVRSIASTGFLPVDRRPGIARALGQRLGHLRGVDVAIVRVPQAPDHVVGREERVALAHLGRAQDLEREPLRRRHAGDVVELRQPVPGMREPDAAARAMADRLARLRRQRPVQPVAVGLQLHHVPGGREVRAVAGGMPGRAGGQFVPLDQHDVPPAEPRQVIEHAAADDAAADHHHPCLRLHGPPPAGPLCQQAALRRKRRSRFWERNGKPLVLRCAPRSSRWPRRGLRTRLRAAAGRIAR